MTTREFLSRFPKVKRLSDGSHMVLCPGHADRNPSLHVTEKTDRILLHCHGDCTTEAVLDAMGLQSADLFFDTPAPTATNGTRPRLRTSNGASPVRSKNVKTTTTYSYRNAEGEVVFEQVRRDYEDGTKDFRIRRPDGAGGWIYDAKGVTFILFRLPELLASDASVPVFLVEGEKCVTALLSLGLLATTSPLGAGKWRPEYAEALRGRHVVCLADQDDLGRAHMQAAAATLVGTAASVKLPTLPGLADKGDVADWIAGGGTCEALERIVTETPEWTPPIAEPLTLDQEIDAVMAAAREDTTWHFRREGDDFRFHFADRTRITVSRVRAKRGGIAGLIEVEHPAYGRLDYGPIDVSSRSGMEMLRKKLRAKAGTIEWEHHLDQVAYVVLTEFQRDDSEQPLSDVTLTPLTFAMAPLVPLGEPTIFVGKRGAGKTMSIYALAVSWVTGIPLPGLTPNPAVLGPVLVLDYETTASTARRRADRIARALGADPDDVMRKIIHRRMAQPLADVAAELRATIARRQVRTVIVDSWKPACGVTGAGDTADGPTAAFSALRTFDRTALIVAHHPKDGGSVYGSIFNEALVRSLVEVKRLGDPMSLEMSLVLTQTKVNEGRIIPPLGLSFVYEPDLDAPFYPRLVRIGSHELRDEPDAQTSRWAKIRAVFLRDRQMLTVGQIADFTGIGQASVRAEMSLHADEVVSAFVPGDSRKKRYGLADNRGHGEP